MMMSTLSTGSVISSIFPRMMVMRSLKPLAATMSRAWSAIVEQSTPITSLCGGVGAFDDAGCLCML